MGLQVMITEWISRLADLLPVGYAFGAGMVSSVNPCGFAMLPAYLSLYMGAEDSEFYRWSRIRRAWKALWVALIVASGFTVLFAVMGGLLSAGGTMLVVAMPWIALWIGIGLVGLGLWMLWGHHLSAAWVQKLANRIGDPREVSVRGFFMFGMAFGAASLSCTLPVFLVVTGSAMVAGTFFSGITQFLSYAMGMGAVLLVLTMGIALFKEGFIVGNLRKFMPHIQKVSAFFLILAGSYIMYYWMSSGMLLS
jgi:cytochrome c biogenesis protein CcdA